MEARRTEPRLLLLVAITGLGPLAFNILIPSMPGLAEAFAVDYATAQLTLSLYLIGFGISQLVYGPLSDHYGRRPVLLAGLAVFLAGTGTALLASSIEQLIVGRVLQAMGCCAGIVIVRAIVRDLYDRDEAASKIAYVVMAMIVVPMLAPFLGGLLDAWYDWRAGFLLVGAAGACVGIATLLGLPETNRSKSPAASVSAVSSSYLKLLKRPLFRFYAMQTAFGSACFFGFMAGAPQLSINALGVDPALFGLALLFPGLAYMTASFCAGRFSARVGVQGMLEIGCLITLLGGISFFVVSLVMPLSMTGLFLPMALFAFGNGLNLPNSTAGAISVDPSRAGAASALSGFTQMALGALVSALVGAVTHSSAVPMAAIIALCAVVQYGAFVGVRRTETKRLPQQDTITAAE